MAAKKKAVKKKHRVRPCTEQEICKFLKELNAWLKLFHADYTKVRIALCNVEAKAFDGLGTQGKRFCSGGVGGDPNPPPAPPKWE